MTRNSYLGSLLQERRLQKIAIASSSWPVGTPSTAGLIDWQPPLSG